MRRYVWFVLLLALKWCPKLLLNVSIFSSIMPSWFLIMECAQLLGISFYCVFYYFPIIIKVLCHLMKYQQNIVQLNIFIFDLEDENKRLVHCTQENTNYSGKILRTWHKLWLKSHFKQHIKGIKTTKKIMVKIITGPKWNWDKYWGIILPNTVCHSTILRKI